MVGPKGRCLVRLFRNKTDSMKDLCVMGEEAPERQVDTKASVKTEDELPVTILRYLSGCVALVFKLVALQEFQSTLNMRDE